MHFNWALIFHFFPGTIILRAPSYLLHTCMKCPRLRRAACKTFRRIQYVFVFSRQSLTIILMDHIFKNETVLYFCLLSMFDFLTTSNLVIIINQLVCRHLWKFKTIILSRTGYCWLLTSTNILHFAIRVTENSCVLCSQVARNHTAALLILCVASYNIRFLFLSVIILCAIYGSVLNLPLRNDSIIK